LEVGDGSAYLTEHWANHPDGFRFRRVVVVLELDKFFVVAEAAG
jgi:hypothetical protein